MRTAPTYTGTATYVVVSYRFIDANNQLGSVPFLTTTARATVANIEGMADALADASNANLYDIVVENHTAAATASPAAAAEEPRESVKDVILNTQRDSVSRKTQSCYIPAPLDSLLVPETNEVDVTAPLISAYALAAGLLLPTTYASVSYRFSEHKGTNKKTRV